MSSICLADLTAAPARPLDWDQQGEEMMCLNLYFSTKALKRSEVNWAPLSVKRVWGTP